jgi:hypothetical protein
MRKDRKEAEEKPQNLLPETRKIGMIEPKHAYLSCFEKLFFLFTLVRKPLSFGCIIS